MRKFSKGLTTVLCVMVIILALTGCASSMDMVGFWAEDTVEVTLDTSEGLMLMSECFNVMEDGDSILRGMVTNVDVCETDKTMLEADDMAEFIEEGSANDITWILYNVDDTECHFIVWIDGSDTGMILTSGEDPDTAKKAFNSLTFSVK